MSRKHVPCPKCGRPHDPRHPLCVKCGSGGTPPRTPFRGRWVVEVVDGYVYLHRPSHPHANVRGFILEHRLVMEAHLGRTLLPTEVVHHINDDRGDNRIENLMRFDSNSDHIKHHRSLKAGK